MRTVNQWLDEYGESHQNHTNKSIHWVCVPAIFFSIVGLLYSIKLPWIINDTTINVAMIVLLLTTLYYLRLSLPLGIGMFLFGLLCLFLCFLIEKYVPVPLWMFSVAIFIIAWIGQFYGHNIEGKKPSFLKDIQFLLIGPMWLMSFIYKKWGINF
jgi:uncharacterized membrane protein YGL010W